jgi:hypothetical protein
MTTDKSGNVYDTDEARGILAHVRNELSQVAQEATRKIRAPLNDQLLQEAEDLLKAAGFDVTKGEDGNVILNVRAVCSVHLRSADGNLQVTGVQKHPKPPSLLGWKTAEITLALDGKKLEGLEDDKQLAPIPGGRIPKRSALAVVAALVADCMRESARS